MPYLIYGYKCHRVDQKSRRPVTTFVKNYAFIIIYGYKCHRVDQKSRRPVTTFVKNYAFIIINLTL